MLPIGERSPSANTVMASFRIISEKVFMQFRVSFHGYYLFSSKSRKGSWSAIHCWCPRRWVTVNGTASFCRSVIDKQACVIYRNALYWWRDWFPLTYEGTGFVPWLFPFFSFTNFQQLLIKTSWEIFRVVHVAQFLQISLHWPLQILCLHEGQFLNLGKNRTFDRT